ncbi:vacuolar-processing enzyme-like [Pyrus ussuriensis x Pyrus communis]|uniref:Vacuolar-processing enzyme-like n=1 Tax=Pyrus ussuriensis x Pyrus communis TaxID=2448454 RepID=A0A5N5GE42_9ROSA|nr:vacuolar-processing enzyme-like [Pyrus ussuriensis x Pyrus communis]
MLKKGGMNDENILVFMYDDIALAEDNPKPGVIINKPDGKDVYKGVPKDYIKDDVNAANLHAVILGNNSALSGGSGKVLHSGPNDHVFIYYTDHGATGLIGMPVGDPVYAKDLVHAFINLFIKIIYMSMFEGLLPNKESSYATYCPGQVHVPPEYHTCLGDLYSLSWMEDCDAEDLQTETLAKQYELVRKRTNASHVMEYGDMSHRQDVLSTYIGRAPAANPSYTSLPSKTPPHRAQGLLANSTLTSFTSCSRFKLLFHGAPTGSQKKLEAQKQLLDEISQREHADCSVKKIGELLFGNEMASKALMNVRPLGKPLVDDWDCFKTLVSPSLGTYERRCGGLSRYGRNNTRAIANICNAGTSMEKMDAA